MHFAIKASKLRDKKLVSIDKTVFKFNTFNTKAWSGKYSIIHINDADAKMMTVGLITAISKDYVLEGYSLNPI